jgi:hypothetical protein
MFSYFDSMTYRKWLSQNRHYKRVTDKIVFLKELQALMEEAPYKNGASSLTLYPVYRIE